jgi:hypothetical protein
MKGVQTDSKVISLFGPIDVRDRILLLLNKGKVSLKSALHLSFSYENAAITKGDTSLLMDKGGHGLPGLGSQG